MAPVVVLTMTILQGLIREAHREVRVAEAVDLHRYLHLVPAVILEVAVVERIMAAMAVLWAAAAVVLIMLQVTVALVVAEAEVFLQLAQAAAPSYLFTHKGY